MQLQHTKNLKLYPYKYNNDALVGRDTDDKSPSVSRGHTTTSLSASKQTQQVARFRI